MHPFPRARRQSHRYAPVSSERLEDRRLLSGLTGQYFDRVDFTELKLTREDATVDFSWAGAPGPAIAADGFSVRWRGQVEAPSSETYTFFVANDDGARLWVDGRLLIDSWLNQSASVERSAPVAFEAGRRYDIRLDYFDNTSSSQVKLSWSSASQSKQVIPTSRLFPSPAGLTGAYYDNEDFTGLALSRNDGTVNFDWRSGTPDPAIGSDTFSVRWTGQVVPAHNETYTFYATGDSLARLRVDGQLVVDSTSVQDGGVIKLEAGKRYDIQFDYAEDAGTAFARLEWSSPSQPRQVIPQANLFASVATAVPSRRADYTNAVLNADRPDPGVIFADGFYWMVHTSGGPNVGWPLYKSADMTSWTFVKHLLDSSNKPAFMTDAFWAPEIHKIGNQFVLTGTSWSDQLNHLVVALATAPEIGGPYTVQPAPIISDTRHVLDSHIFQDHDGRVYMLWKRDGPSNGQFGSIRIREMNAAGTAFLTGSSAVTILDNSVGGWERNLAEAPWMVRRGGFYYLFYSGGFIDTTYSLGVARSTSPTTPFTRHTANPIITHNGTFAGPGHGGFALDRDGTLWHLYHSRYAANPDFGRVQVLDKVVWGADGWPSFGSGGTVSTTLQPGPVVDAASGAGLVTVVGDVSQSNQNDVIRLVRGADASMLDVYVNGSLSRSVRFGEVQQLTVDGRGGNDTLYLDYSRGEAMPGAGIRFFGSGGSDTVRLVGAGAVDAFRYAGGQFSHGSGLVTLSGVEQFLLEAGSFTFNSDAAGAALEAAAGARILFNVSQQLAALTLTGGSTATLASATAAAAAAAATATAVPINSSTSPAVRGGGAKGNAKVKARQTSLVTATALSIRTPANSRVLVVNGNTFTIDATSKLDLTDNNLILNYSGASPAAGVEAMVKAGYNGGDWLGNRITSSAANANRNFALGVADNSRLTIPFGDGTTGRLFSGQAVDSTAVLVKFTHRVDLDLDGVITTNDATIFNSNYSEGAAARWAIGDADFDGLFSTNDATLFNSFYDESLGAV